MRKAPTAREAIDNLILCMEDIEPAIKMFREYAWFFEMQEPALTSSLYQIENYTKMSQWYQSLNILKKLRGILAKEEINEKKNT